jgi:glycosyltransferase involved in cell wall biosynthesis
MARADISIIVTCYHKEEYLDECINSIAEQTMQPREIILVHDGCKTPAAHCKATTIIFPTNQGVAFARAEGVRFSKGKLLLFLDGDDKIPPDYLERMLRCFPKADIAFPDIFWWYGEFGENRIDETPWKLDVKEMYRVCKVPVTCLMKRDVFTTLGGFKPFKLYEDWDFWLRAIVKGFKFAKANTILYYRQNPKTRNRTSRQERHDIYKQIKSQFTLKGGKLCLNLPTKP